jgi:hypothetical protein
LDDVEGEVVNIRAAGFQTRKEIIDFHLRKLVFLDGPEKSWRPLYLQLRSMVPQIRTSASGLLQPEMKRYN